MPLVHHLLRDLGEERIEGAARRGRTLVTSGDRLLLWRLPDLRMDVVRQEGAFGRAVCLAEVESRLNVVATGTDDRGLVRFEAPDWRRREIDRGVVTRDILPAVLHGRRGVLVVHRGAQVRFYELASGAAREIYSFYSAAEQGGLMLRDVDGDGRADILCGNYWLQCPPALELPWRLYAIRIWSDEPASVFAWSGPHLVAAQREGAGARLSWFEKPADPRELWGEHPIEGTLELDHPGAIAAAEFGLAVGERGGAGRLILYRDWRPQVLGSGAGVVFLHPMDWNRDGRADLLMVGRRSLAWWENRG